MIYLDHNATTPLDPAVRRAMAEAMETVVGNPSSQHALGRRARDAVEAARDQVAALLGASPEEVVFCSGGTEGDHLGIRGAARAVRARDGRRVVVASPLEHPAVRGALEALVDEGFAVRWLPVTADGELDLEGAAGILDGAVALVSCALANHELGNRYPIAELAALAHRAGALLHCDAVQAVGRLPVDVAELGVDLLTASAHKLHGPKGVGALYLRRGAPWEPLLRGGGQERGRRPGTENVLGIVGFGVACAVAGEELAVAAPRIAALRDRLEAAALQIPGARRFGGGPRLPGTSCLGFAGAPGQLVAVSLDLEDVAVSTGAACTSGRLEPSPVLAALGVGGEEAATAVRFSLGRGNTADELDQVVRLLPSLIARVRGAFAGP